MPLQLVIMPRLDLKIMKLIYLGAQIEQRIRAIFLSLVESEDFQRVKMPLGAYKKDDVWEELKKRGIEPALTYESQEICFIKDNYRDFLKKNGEKNSQTQAKLLGSLERSLVPTRVYFPIQ